MGDLTPSPYGVPARKWSALRRALTAFFKDQGVEAPTAVAFRSESDGGWATAEVFIYYGGRRTAHEKFQRGSAVWEALEALTRFERPVYCEPMRIALPH